jgi:hypothetical protein
VKSGTTLGLTAGNYYFGAFTLEPQGTVQLDTSAGPIFIYTQSFIHRGQLIGTTASNPSLIGDLFVGVIGSAGATAGADIEKPFNGTLVSAGDIDILAGYHWGTFISQGTVELHEGLHVTPRFFQYPWCPTCSWPDPPPPTSNNPTSLAGLGNPCGCNNDCASGLCGSGDGTCRDKSGSCQAPPTCGCNSDCLSLMCLGGDGKCGDGSGSCLTQAPWTGAGASCGCNTDCASGVCSGGNGKCGDASGACQAPPAGVGASCGCNRDCRDRLLWLQQRLRFRGLSGRRRHVWRQLRLVQSAPSRRRCSLWVQQRLRFWGLRRGQRHVRRELRVLSASTGRCRRWLWLQQ